jgi:flagellar motor switch protein FliG
MTDNVDKGASTFLREFMSSPKYTAAEKAAIVLLTLGETDAAEVLKQLPSSEVKRILTATARLGRIDQLTADEVMTDFAESMLSMKKGIEGSPQAAAKFLHQFSRARAIDFDPKSIIDFATPALKETLTRIDPKSLATYLKNEHPQVTAVVLLHLEPNAMGTVLKFFSNDLRTQLVLRIAKVQSVDPDMIVEIEEALSKEFNNARPHAKKLGGLEKIAATLNTLTSEAAEKTLAELSIRDPQLAEAVRASMFTFNDLLRIDVKDLQTLLKAAIPSDLKAALRGADSAMTNHILSAMSKRAADVMIEDIAAGGKLPLSVIQAARSQLAALARQMIAEGKIILPLDQPFTQSA